MFRLLIPCLIWLSSVRSETAVNMHMHMPDGMVEDKMTMKRESYYNPCPPTFAHPISYSPPPQIYVKPYVEPAPVHYIPKPMITYVKPSPPPIIVKPSPPVIVKQAAPVIVKPVVQPVVQPKVVYPIYQKPMVSYAPIYQKPIYYAPMYQKLLYQAPKVYLKKYELPVTQVIHKPQISYPVQYHQSKVVQVQAPQVSYVKLAQPIVHPQPIYQTPIKPYCP
ncbi:PREDICTED: extensin-2-like [Eufriesea mexicana]|uniref:extensin-2-like n=1 Tax=Eufriesea mexicana TaxID=516756 RepID=UPI00083BEF7E|nr:PREDICTED: extensin-2-like [Eufriesea mexicana]